MAPAARRRAGRLPTVRAEARRRGGQCRGGLLNAIGAPVKDTLLTPPSSPPPRRTDAPTDAAGVRGHASAAPVFSAPTSGGKPARLIRFLLYTLAPRAASAANWARDCHRDLKSRLRPAPSRNTRLERHSAGAVSGSSVRCSGR